MRTYGTVQSWMRSKTAFKQEPLPDGTFACYLVTKTDLRSLVNDSFKKMEELSVTK